MTESYLDFLKFVLKLKVPELKKECPKFQLTTKGKRKPELQLELIDAFFRENFSIYPKDSREYLEFKDDDVDSTISDLEAICSEPIVSDSSKEVERRGSTPSLHDKEPESDRLMFEIVRSKSKTGNSEATQDGSEATQDEMYDDLYATDTDYFGKISFLLNSKLNRDCGQHVMAFLCGNKNEPLIDSLAYWTVDDDEENSYSYCGQYLTAALNDVFIKQHACSMDCYHRFEKSGFYHHYNHEYFDNLDPTKKFIRGKHTGVYQMGMRMELVKGWYGKVVPIENGNCLVDSLFEMRNMIRSSYSHILDRIWWGVINDDEKFTKLVNSLEPTKESLDFFPYLLSTANVFFINVKGELLHGIQDIRMNNFYSCYFLISSMNPEDETIAHINPIQFGCNSSDIMPSFLKNPKFKFLFGDKWKKQEKSPWLTEEFRSIIKEKVSFLYRPDPKLKRNLDLSENSSVDDAKQHTLPNTNSRKAISSPVSDSALQNPTDSSFENYVEKSHAINLDFVFYIGKKSEADIRDEYCSYLRNPFIRHSIIMSKEVLASNEISDMKNSKKMTFPKSSKTKAFRLNQIPNSNKKKRTDLIIHMRIHPKYNHHKLFSLVEFKRIDEFCFNVIPQVVYYHIQLETDARYLVVSCLIFNIILECDLKSNRYIVIYDDTDHFQSLLASYLEKPKFRGYKTNLISKDTLSHLKKRGNSNFNAKDLNLKFLSAINAFIHFNMKCAKD